MNVKCWSGIVALAFSLGTVSLYAQTPRQPGQIATEAGSSQPIVLSPDGELPGNPAASPLRSSRVAFVSDDHRSVTVWKISIATMLAATAFDAASSWGKSEQNPLLESSNGTFGAKGLAVKASLAGVSLVPQLIFRKNKDLRKIFTIINFGDTAMFTAIASHNLGIKPVQQ
ncbi:MAG: hypothetical protein WAM39_24455 [Bryobacteraceae bacterium]